MTNIHWSYYFLFLGLLTGIYTDASRHKLYNWLTLPLLFLGLIFSFLNGVGIFSSLLGFVGAFVIAFFLYLTKGIYGGDVKLMAAIGAWVGKDLLFITFFWIFISGGVLSLLYTIRYGTFLLTMKKIGRFFTALFVKGMNPQAELTQSENKYVPYGIAIAAGTVIALFYPELLSFKK